LLNGPVLPDDRLRFKVKSLTGWIWRCILRHSDHLIPVVELVGQAVVAPEGGQSAECPISPEEPEAFKVIAEKTKILPVRVWDREVRIARDIPSRVGVGKGGANVPTTK